MVCIKDVRLGEGITKICVPIIGKTVEEICQEAMITPLLPP